MQLCAIGRKLIPKLLGQYFKTLARIERDVLAMLQSIRNDIEKLAVVGVDFELQQSAARRSQ